MTTIIKLSDYISDENTKSVLVGGCFDIIHIGHVRFLEAARNHGDKLIIALEGDEFIKNRKKREPFHSQEERAEVLSALHNVDEVVLLPLLTSTEDYALLVEKIHPAIIAITENDPQEENKRTLADRIGAKVISVISTIPHKSTTKALNENPSKTELA